MSNRESKPKRTSENIIDLMEENGIKFNLISKEDAALYLSTKNNYLRTASYRINYEKYQRGINEGKYIDLDFAYLTELSTIDMHFRYLVSKMCLEIEHALKIKILHEIDNNPDIDGYQITYDFLSKHSNIIKKNSNKINSPFIGDLVNSYFGITEVVRENNYTTSEITNYDDCPIWVLLEIISFGELIKFYRFYYEYLILIQAQKIDSITENDIICKFLFKKNNIVFKINSSSKFNLDTKLINRCYLASTGKPQRDSDTPNLPDDFNFHIKDLVRYLSADELFKLYSSMFKESPDFIKPINISILNIVRDLRNCVAHNNCALYNLKPFSAKPAKIITQAISRIEGLSNAATTKKMSCRTIQNFVTMLFVYDELVSGSIRDHRVEELKDLFQNRMQRHNDYFEKNDLIKTSYEFVCKSINGIFDCGIKF